MSRSVAVGLAAVVVLTVLVYSPFLDGPFVYDDLPHIAHNVALGTPGDLGAVLYSGWQGTRPLYNLSLALNAWSGGVDPRPFRIFNLLLHLGCGALVWLLARRLGSSGWAGALAMALFLLHPVQTESVLYINSRSGLLATFFGLAALLHATRVDRLSLGGGVTAVILAIVSAACKESAAVLPLLVWLISGSWRRALLLLPAVLVVPLLFVVFPSPHEGTIGLGIVEPMAHLRAQPYAVLRLAALLLAPVGQNVDHYVPLPTAWLSVRVLLPAVLVGAALLVCVRALKRRSLLGLALAWFFVALAPTNSVVPFVDIVAERHLYFVSVGPLVCAAVWVGRLAVGRRPLRVVSLASFIVVLLSGLTLFRARVWRSDLALWTDSVSKSPHKGRPHLNLGVALGSRGEIERSIAEFRTARELDPTLREPLFNEGVALLRLGRPNDAVRCFERVLEDAPRDALARLQLAEALSAAGRTLDSLRELESVTAAGGRVGALAVRRRGVLLHQLGRYAEARNAWRAYLVAHPDDAGAWYNLGFALESTLSLVEAVEAFEMAVKLAPGDSRFAGRLARARERAAAKDEATEPNAPRPSP